MNVTLNSLPTKTWNWLKMNDITVKVDPNVRPFAPQADAVPDTVRWEPNAEWQGFGDAHGLSPDLTALSAAAGTDLATTAPGVRMEAPLVLRYHYESGDRTVSRLVLHASENSTMNVVIAETSSGGDFSALQVVIKAEKGSAVNLCMAQLLGSTAVCLNEIGGTQAEDAEVHLIRLELGAEKAYMGCNLYLSGARSSFASEVGYHAKSGQLLDMNYVAVHHGKSTTSLMEASGTLEENSRKIFRGTIDFQQGCAGAKGTENENVLLLGEDLVNQTIPLILCKEEDVEGNHGASIGQLDEKLLFYLGSRGISAESASRMIARARIQSICSKIPDETVRNLVEAFEYGEDFQNETELQS